MALKLGSTGSALRVGSTTAKYARVGTTLKAVAPPLDIAGSAAAAYSLRKLSYAYTGPVVKVRRSSDDTTADFTADEVEGGTLAAWVGAGNNGFVATWYDQSGNSRDATQATAGSQPQIVSSGSVVTEGGKPAIQFDGTNDYLSNPLTVWGRGGTGEFNVIIVAKCEAKASGVGTLAAARRNSTPFDGWQVRNNSSSTGTLFAVDYNGTLGDGVTGAKDTRGSAIVLHASFNGMPALHVNGGYDVSSAANEITVAYSPTVTTLNIGASGLTASAADFHKGTMQELFLYRVDTSSQRTAIEGNLCWHYGLQSKLPYNHAEVKPQTLPTDTDVLAFAAASGATSIPDLLKIEDLVAYLKAESLWDYARFYPMKSAQNAGSGSTVYGLGGLTSNNMTLVNSPTWGSDGVTFNGSTQYGNCGRLFNGGNITAFTSVRYLGDPATTATIFGQYSGSTNERSFAAGVAGSEAGDPLRLWRFSTGASSQVELYEPVGAPYPSVSQQTIVAQWAGADVAFWINNESYALTIASGAPLSSAYNANQPVFFAASNNNGAGSLHANIESAAFLFLTGNGVSASATQRETITDLINDL